MISTANTNTDMRFLFLVLGCLAGTSAMAQGTEKYRSIGLTYSPEKVYAEEAIQTIVSTSRVSERAIVTYKAGQSIMLRPGFNTDRGASFLAHIATVSDVKLRLAAYPNPFEQTTTIQFDLPKAGRINLYVVDLQGKVVGRLLENSQQAAGRHEFEWKPEALPSGMYTPILQTDQERTSSRIIKK